MKKIKRLIYLFAMLLFTFILYSNNKVNALADVSYDCNCEYSYETSVDNPIGIMDLIEEIELKAYDNNNLEDISDSIVCYNDDGYTVNVINKPTGQTRKLGTYDLTYRCYDKYGNYCDCVITINVVDKVKPVVDGDNSKLIVSFKKNEINSNAINIIFNGIVARDNHDYALIKEFGETDFDIDTSIGYFSVPVIVKDLSGNYTTVNVEIEITDEIGPAIGGKNTYLKIERRETPITFDEIMDVFELSAYDFETDKLCEIKISRDDYSENCNNPGLYLYKLCSLDMYGNVTNVDCYIEVIDSIAPQFFLASAKVNITDKDLFNLDEADRIIKERKLNKQENYKLSVYSDNYTNNYQEEGEYRYSVKADYDDETYSIIEFIINVLKQEEITENKEDVNEEIKDEDDNKNEVNNTKEKIGLFKRIANFFKSIGLFFSNIYKWLVNKINSVFNKKN